MAEVRLKCFQCSNDIVLPYTPGRRDECSKCGADLHVCKNCKNYDRNAYNECREPQADVVLEKERANFCDFFTPGGSGASAADKAKDLRAAAEALFKKK